MAGLCGRLTVHVHSARSLKDVELTGKQDPYVKLSIGKETFKTKVMKNSGTEAEWEQSFLFNVKQEEEAIYIKVMDHEFLKDRIIGCAHMGLQQLINAAGHGVPYWIQLSDVKQSQSAGQVSLSAEFNGTGLKTLHGSGSPKNSATLDTNTNTDENVDDGPVIHYEVDFGQGKVKVNHKKLLQASVSGRTVRVDVSTIAEVVSCIVGASHGNILPLLGLAKNKSNGKFTIYESNSLLMNQVDCYYANTEQYHIWLGFSTTKQSSKTSFMGITSTKHDMEIQYELHIEDDTELPTMEINTQQDEEDEQQQDGDGDGDGDGTSPTGDADDDELPWLTEMMETGFCDECQVKCGKGQSQVLDHVTGKKHKSRVQVLEEITLNTQQHEHPLAYRTCPYQGNFDCDVCGTGHAAASFHCDECKYDCCMPCFNAMDIKYD